MYIGSPNTLSSYSFHGGSIIITSNLPKEVKSNYRRSSFRYTGGWFLFVISSSLNFMRSWSFGYSEFVFFFFLLVCFFFVFFIFLYIVTDKSFLRSYVHYEILRTLVCVDVVLAIVVPFGRHPRFLLHCFVLFCFVFLLLK